MKKIVTLIIIFAFMTSIIACNNEIIGGYVHPDFDTNYTISEHITRLRSRTIERFKREILNGEIVHISVDIVYAFYDDDPEYFVVDIEYKDEVSGIYVQNEESQYSTKYKHVIGFIEDDEYKLGLPFYSDFIAGRSSYKLYGYDNSKKYYGACVQAVEQDNCIFQIANESCLIGFNIEFHEHSDGAICPAKNKKIISESEYERLMKSNFKLDKLSY